MVVEYVIAALCVLSIVATCVLYVYEKKGRTLLWEVRALLERFHTMQLQHTWATVSLHQTLGDLKAPLPIASGWALGSDTLAFLHARIIQKAPRLVVELGSGLSTLILSNALRPVHGRLVSVEADAHYLEVTRRQLEVAGLADVVTPVHAPLERHGESRLAWYRREALVGIVDVDMLLVDGTPAGECPTVRYPALPFSRERLAPGASVLLDDCDRAREQAVVECWQKEFAGLDVQMLSFSRPVALIATPTAGA